MLFQNLCSFRVPSSIITSSSVHLWSCDHFLSWRSDSVRKYNASASFLLPSSLASDFLIENSAIFQIFGFSFSNSQKKFCEVSYWEIYDSHSITLLPRQSTLCVVELNQVYTRWPLTHWSFELPLNPIFSFPDSTIKLHLKLEMIFDFWTSAWGYSLPSVCADLWSWDLTDHWSFDL